VVVSTTPLFLRRSFQPVFEAVDQEIDLPLSAPVGQTIPDSQQAYQFLSLPIDSVEVFGGDVNPFRTHFTAKVLPVTKNVV
jgi:hypothetical protein